MLKHREDRLFVRFQNPRIERFCDVGGEMALTTPRKVKLHPVLEFEPRNCPGMDLHHIVESLVESSLCCCSRCLPKKLFELRVFEIFEEVAFDMLEAMTVWTARKNEIHPVDEPFLAVGEENDFLVDERLEGMALDHGGKEQQKPEPVVFVFGVNNGMGKRK